MRVFTSGIGVTLVLALAGFGAGPSGDDVTLEVVPGAADLRGGGAESRLLAVVRNRGDEEIRDVRLSYWTEAGAAVVIEDDKTTRKIEAGADATWTLRLKRSEGALPGEVQIRADYRMPAAKGEEGKEPVARVALAKVSVKRPDAETTEPIAEAKVKMFTEELNETTRHKAYVVVTNKAGVPVRAFLKLGGPDEIEAVNAMQLADLVTLDVGESHLFDVQFHYKGGLVSGKYPIAFDVTILWDDAGGRLERHIVANEDVTVGILGESAVTKLLGVPSLLILPGFLALTVINTFWKWGFLRPGATGDKDAVEPNSAPFWVLAITLSALILIAYYGTMGRNLLVGYRLQDVARLWCVSLMGAAIAYLGVGSAIGFGLFVHRKLFVDPKTFRADDLAIDVIQKLARRGQGIILRRYELGDHANPRQVFLLDGPGDPPDPAWVAPPIVFSPSGDSELAQVDFDRLLDQINAELGKDDPPCDVELLASLLALAKKTRSITIGWQPVAGIAELTRLPAAQLGADRRIVDAPLVQLG